jgi:protein-tyrosine phosphatase
MHLKSRMAPPYKDPSLEVGGSSQLHTMSSSKRDRCQSNSPFSSSTPLPKFLTLPLPTLIHKFKTINAHEASLRSDQKAPFSTPLAQSRNRYPDIYPWAHNRIHLRSLPLPYINASPIDLGRPREKFIATQGPLEVDGGLGHFWEMVWQEECEVVVMLTQAWEDGREKCGAYYPETVGEVKQLEGWGSVQCVGLTEELRTEVRELKVLKDGGEEGEGAGEERVVWHFLFLGWPDHDIPITPEDQKALLELIRVSRFHIQERSDEEGEKVTPPRLVHCSAGVGRTGTFIALDHLLHELEDGRFDDLVVEANEYEDQDEDEVEDEVEDEDEDEYEYDDESDDDDAADPESQDADPVFETVKKLRDQRMYMVGKPRQYAFIYQVLRERWQARQRGDVSPGTGEDSSNSAVSQTKKRRLVQDGSGYELYEDSEKES